MSIKNNMLTAKELAEALSLSVETIWRYTRQQQIPFTEVGHRQYRYDLQQVLRAMNKSQAGVAEEAPDYDRKHNFTYEDYLALPDETGFRHEILEGLLVKEPSPSVRHQIASAQLQEVLRSYFREQDPVGKVLAAPLDVVLTKATVVQPDILYVPGNDAKVFDQSHVDVAPKLVVEVTSPATRRKDRVEKMEIYRKSHIPHYWIADPDSLIIEAYALRNGYYALVSAAADDDILTHPDFPGLEVPLAKVFS